MKAEQLLLKMLKTSTGSHMLDSGGAYGRHWEKNQDLTLAKLNKQPDVIWEGDYFVINVFHYLRGQLELNDVCDTFNKINIKANNWDSDLAYGLSDKGAEYLESIGANIREAWNTYNGETSLSQVLQGSYVDINDVTYVLLQIHQGADVRGGYTDAYLFKLADAYLYPETVYGTVTKPSGEVIQVDSAYNGYSLTSENGSDVEIDEADKVDLWLSE